MEPPTSSLARCSIGHRPVQFTNHRIVRQIAAVLVGVAQQAAKRNWRFQRVSRIQTLLSQARASRRWGRRHNWRATPSRVCLRATLLTSKSWWRTYQASKTKWGLSWSTWERPIKVLLQTEPWMTPLSFSWVQSLRGYPSNSRSTLHTISSSSRTNHCKITRWLAANLHWNSRAGSEFKPVKDAL